MKHYLAIDIGVFSGRNIVDCREAGKPKIKKDCRFSDGVLK